MNKEQLQADLRYLIEEWVDQGHLQEGDRFVIGCSTSEVAGERIGTAGSEDIAAILFNEWQTLQAQTGVELCFQCCEHLNRALVVERRVMKEDRLSQVSVVPVRQAGGSMAAYAYQHLTDPVVVEEIEADAGIDIGETMIGMHLKPVAVPLRMKQRAIGNARVNHARTRPKLIGGPRAVYPE
ncbi:hypothetical protein J416_02681 [Gracilibacillus halophilus YIM-C55.5]|uniref:UPF0340 protein J416_02681 n=1 Tax=Gracilibacillus halophilus YIM-C55.5 TaxID=1308866 RepID=N4WFD2_9BACI|nr:TIGR01440 family protein [Gracilibacillus halophilus]ENH97979.1 hypothetical protein J416_02681 [Gracilibacillus halophilus YIM-C55.5]